MNTTITHNQRQLITSVTRRQQRLIDAINGSAAQRDSYGKLARLAETLPGMVYEIERLWASYNEMEADFEDCIENAIDAGVTPEMMEL